MNCFKHLVTAIGLLVLLFVMACTSKSENSTTSEALDSGEVPEDFKVFAEFSGVLSSLMSFSYTIHADGNVVQELQGKRLEWKEGDKRPRLSKEEIDLLWAKVRDARFFNLKQNYTGSATDQGSFILEITRRKQTHAVKVYGYRFVAAVERCDVNRFLTIWSAIVRLIPAPNRMENPALFDINQ